MTPFPKHQRRGGRAFDSSMKTGGTMRAWETATRRKIFTAPSARKPASIIVPRHDRLATDGRPDVQKFDRSRITPFNAQRPTPNFQRPIRGDRFSNARAIFAAFIGRWALGVECFPRASSTPLRFHSVYFSRCSLKNSIVLKKRKSTL